MKVVLLAGGFGTRISEESYLKPKPMIEIGDKPILWHIMKVYFHYGFNEFIICCGYKQHIVKEWFANYYLHNSDITFDFTNNNQMIIHNNVAEQWKVTLVDTGLHTMTGGRIKRIKKYIGDETFMLTYGDGVANIDINDLIEFHQKSQRLATLTAVQPAGRFGLANINNNNEVVSFVEKPVGDGSWINGGFFVLESKIFDYIEGDQTIWERDPLESLAAEKQLMAYKHYDFWRPMDSMRDKNVLEELWRSDQAPWKIWK
jgi:glucose-1-phosphate cytidylyltransferase